jgi:adhesin/invasin
VGQALNLEARILDNCGVDISTIRGSSVKMSRITTGEPGFDLLHVGGGKWQKSWQPKATANTTVRAYMTMIVPLPNLNFFGQQIPVDIVIAGGNTVPLVEPGSVLNAASFKSNAPVAPGMLISVFGNELAENPGQVASSVPLPTELNNTEVRLGDKPLRLLFSSNAQINAQIPFDLNPNTEHQIVVKRGETISSPENFSVSTTQPAIFATAQNGIGQGAITNAVTGELSDRSKPVRAGDFISIYCTGLGVVTPSVDAGAAAPTTVLSRTVRPVTVTVGGRSAEVAFSGLAPGFVGLYQVNAVIPAGLTPGDEVPVVIETDGQTSPPVTIAVR